MLRQKIIPSSFLALLVFAFVAASNVANGQGGKEQSAGRVPFPQHSITKGKKCVEPTDVMRKRHMEFILHQRDKTMHGGIRTTKHSLKNCINCHADPQTKSVTGKDGFCESCHAYTAVSIDCFGCHTDKAHSTKRTRTSVQAIGRPLSADTEARK